MKNFIILFFLSISITLSAQLDFLNHNETLKYRIHYGILNAGTATLSAKKVNYRGRSHFHVVGTGVSTGAVKAFFPVYDVYESYINVSTGLPSYYVRNVSEGKYRRHFETSFNQSEQELTLYNKLERTSKKFNTVKDLQDMLSAFYYLRSIDNSKFKPGASFRMSVWIDDETYPFLLKVAGIENRMTKFGRISTIKLIPMVMSGRVFRAKEGVTLWVTNDNNHIPVEIKADLVVGSLKASLDNYSNNKFPLKFSR